MKIETKFKSLPWHKRIEVLRTAEGWTQEEAAEKCGSTRKNYGLWESGKSMPRATSKSAIASAFDVPQGEIFEN